MIRILQGLMLSAVILTAPGKAQAFLVAVRDNQMLRSSIDAGQAALEGIEMARDLKKQGEDMKDAIASGDRAAMAQAFGAMAGTIGDMYGQINLAAGAYGAPDILPEAATGQIAAMANLVEIAGGADFQDPEDLANVLGASQEAGVIEGGVLGALDPDLTLELYNTVRGSVDSAKNGRYLDTLNFAEDLLDFPYEESGITKAADEIGKSAVAVWDFFSRNYAPDPGDTIEEIAIKAQRRSKYKQESALRAMAQAAAGAHAIEDQALAQETFQELIEDSDDIRSDLQIMNHLLLHLARVQSQSQSLMAEMINLASLREMTSTSPKERIQSDVANARRQ